MKYTFGIFLISGPDGIANVRSIDDLFELTEAGNATEGVPEIKKLEQLYLISTGSNENLFNPVPNRFSGESKLLLVARSFRDSFATADNDRVSKVASDWADSESWSDTDVNPFDLYGMLHYLNSLCMKACAEDKELYLLLSS
jgi:hypothetical protein